MSLDGSSRAVHWSLAALAALIATMVPSSTTAVDVYVANSAGHTLTKGRGPIPPPVFSLPPFFTERTIVLPGAPRDLAALPDHSTLFVSARSPDALLAVDLSSSSVESISSPQLSRPDAVAVDPNGKFVLVLNIEGPASCGDRGSVVEVDVPSRAVSEAVCVGFMPADVKFSPGGNLAFIVNSGADPSCGDGGSVTVFDPNSLAVTASICAGRSPVAIAFSPTSPVAYVVNQTDATLTEIDTAKVVPTRVIHLPCGPESIPSDIAFTPDGALVLITNFNTRSLQIFGAQNLDAEDVSPLEIRVGEGPVDVAVDVDATGTHAYVSNFLEDSVTDVTLNLPSPSSSVAAVGAVSNAALDLITVRTASVGARPVAVALAAPLPPTPTPDSTDTPTATETATGAPTASEPVAPTDTETATFTVTRTETPTATPTYTPIGCEGDEDCAPFGFCVSGTCRFCVGDCNADTLVSPAEVDRSVDLALERAVDPCSNADLDRDGTVKINEVAVAALNSATDCPDQGDVPKASLPPQASIEIKLSRGSCGTDFVDLRVHSLTSETTLSGLQVDIAFSPSLPILGCTPSPFVGADIGDFEFLPPGCIQGVSCDAVRVLLLNRDGRNLPLLHFLSDPGISVFSCQVSRGTYKLQNPIGTDANGNLLPVQFYSTVTAQSTGNHPRPGGGAIRCTSDDVCPSTQVCDGRICRQPCQSNANCQDAEVCAQRVCRRPCSEDADCPATQFCDDNFCTGSNCFLAQQFCEDPDHECPCGAADDYTVRVCPFACIPITGCSVPVADGCRARDQSLPVPSASPTPTSAPTSTPTRTSSGTVTPTVSSPSGTPTRTPLTTSTSSRTFTPMRAPSPTATLMGTAAIVTPTATPTRPRRCDGDCDGNGEVDLGEVQRSFNVFRGTIGLDQCLAADADLGGDVSLGEVQKAFNTFLLTCGG